MWLSLTKEQKEKIASGNMEALKNSLVKCRIDNISYLTSNTTDVSKYQGVGQLVDELLDIFQLKICLKKE
jgi:hypothetical protein